MSSGDTPRVAIFCATFLKPEMWHIYRHVAGLRDFLPVVITQKPEGRWPVPDLRVVRRSPWRWIGRAREKRGGGPWQISGPEAQAISSAASGSCLLHVFFGNVAVHLLPFLRATETPFVVSFHGADVTGGIATEPFRGARFEVFQRARLILCRSEELARRVAALGCPEEKIRLMRTVIPERPAVPRTPPADGAWHIVQAARWIPKKGITTALRAFARFRRNHPRARFTLAGGGPMEAELRHLASSLGIAQSVRFSGFLDRAEMELLFESAHVFVHPSETVGGDVEGVPNALLEAMISGLPAVATRHGGIPEVIRDGENGLLADERDEETIAAALERLVTDDAFRERMAHAGAETVRREFGESRQIAAIESLYREAAGLSA